MDESTVDQEYLDPATGALTRAAWARLRGGSIVLLPAGILLAYSAGFFDIAVWRFQYES